MDETIRRGRGKLLRIEAAFYALGLAAAAFGQTASDAIAVKTIAEVETRVPLHDGEAIKLAPADRVVPGDQVVYTVEIRNTRAAPVAAPVVRYPIPNHVRYLAGSAAAPGAEVSYSIDGGRTFDWPENLKVAGPKGDLHVASAADYTHIRWQLRHALKGHAVAFARFRAVVK